jgi:hypothetical protein
MAWMIKLRAREREAGEVGGDEAGHGVAARFAGRDGLAPE